MAITGCIQTRSVTSYLLYMVWTGIDDLQEGGLLDVSVLLLFLKANEVFLSSLAEFHLIETIHFLLHMDGSSTSVHCNKLITRINIAYATRFWNVISKGLAPVAPEMNILGIKLIDPGIGGHVPGRGKGYSTSIFVVVFSSLHKYKRLADSDAKQETSLSGRPPSTPILYSTHICKPVYNKDLISASFVIKLKRDVGEAWDHVPVTVVCTTWQLVTHVPIFNKYLELAAILLHGNWQYKREVTMTLTAEVQTPTYTQLELRLQCLIWLNTTKLWSYLLRSIVSIKWVTNISTGVVDNAIVAAFCSVAVLSSWSSRMSLQMASTHRLQLAIRLDSLVGRVVWSTLHCPQPFWCFKSLQDSQRDATCVSSQKISHWIQSRSVYEPGGQSCATFLPFSFVTFTVGGLSVLNAIAGAYSENLPVLYISVGGPTIRMAKAADAFVELADSCGSAVAVMPSAKGLISETHPWLLVVVLGSFSCCWNAGYFVYPPPAIVDELGNWISLQTVSPSWRIRCLGLKQPAWEKADIKWVLLGCDNGCCSECHFSLLRVYCALAEIAWLILYCRGTPLTDNMLEKATLEGLHTVGKYIVFQANCLNALQHSSVSQQYFGAANGNRRSAVITKLKLFEMIPLLYPRNFVTKLCIAKRGLGDSKTQQPFFITRSWQRLQCGAGVLDCYGSNNRHMSENEMSSEVRYGWALDMGIKHSQYSTLRYYLSSKLVFVSWRCTKHWYYQALVLVTGLLENPELPLNSLALCTTLNGWVFMISVGFNAAASVRVSNELGASHPKSAAFSVTVVTVLSFITSVVITILQLGYSFIWSYTLFSVIHVYMFLVLLLDKVFSFFPGLAQQPRDELLP